MMTKPQPTQEAIIKRMTDRTICITVHTPDALSIVDTACQFGTVYKSMTQANRHDLFVDDGYDVVEVLQYLNLKSQVWKADRTDRCCFKEDSMQRAINIVDYATIIENRPDVVILLKPHLTTEQVRAEQTIDGMALRLVDLPDKQFNAILEILRNGKGKQPGIPKHKLRIYERKKSGWKRV
jgi:hypothetical protein